MSLMEEQRARSRRSFTDDFKRDAVALVLDEDRKIVDVARSVGVGEGTLGIGCARPASIGVSGRGRPRRSGPSWSSCAGRTRRCGWNEICLNRSTAFW
jgi:transposase-like protein